MSKSATISSKGDLPVGEVLSRRKLAEELNISALPVSEAPQRLERDGLVESSPRAGTRVRIPTRQDVKYRSLVREALDTQPARLFAERATPAEKKGLRQMGRHMNQLYAAADTDPPDRDFLFSANACHMKLHLRIAECARCPARPDVALLCGLRIIRSVGVSVLAERFITRGNVESHEPLDLEKTQETQARPLFDGALADAVVIRNSRFVGEIFHYESNSGQPRNSELNL